jgi:uncharacterized protein DUF3572
MSVMQDPWRVVADHPEAVALRAVGFLQSRRLECERFLARAGLSEADLGRRPIQPEHLAAILDFLIANEATLLDFARTVDLLPETAYEARRLFDRRAPVHRRMTGETWAAPPRAPPSEIR